MNENSYIAHKIKKTSTRNLSCSQRQILPVHICKLSQAKTTNGTCTHLVTNVTKLKWLIVGILAQYFCVCGSRTLSPAHRFHDTGVRLC